MSNIFADPLTGNGVSLDSTSANWKKVFGYSASLWLYDDVLRTTDSASSTSYAYYNDEETPPSADYSVSCDLIANSIFSNVNSCGVIGRCSTSAATFYTAYYQPNLGMWRLSKRIANSETLLASLSATLTAGNTYRVKLVMNGSSISMYVNDVLTAGPVTDTSITATGFPGLRRYDTTPTTATTGIHYDSFSADTIDAGGGAVTHTSTCALVSSSATIAATSARTGSVVTHASTGALVSGSSVIAAAASRASAGIASFSTPPIKNNTGTVRASTSGWTINVFNVSTGALVVQKTGLSTDASGVISVSDASLVSGTSYAYEAVNATYGRGLPIASAA